MRKRLCRGVSGLGFVLAVALWGAAGSASIASACSYAAPPPKFNGVPADGDTGVPTNVIPSYLLSTSYSQVSMDGGVTVIGDKYTLETEAGELVAVTVRGAQSGHFEIVPAQPLVPNTKYRVRGIWQGFAPGEVFTDALAFTTGAGPRSGEVPPPIAALTNLVWTQEPFSTCSPAQTRTCITLQDPSAVVEYVMIDNLGSVKDDEPYATQGSVWTTDLNPATQTQSPFVCVRLRTRAIDATYSEPVVLCGKDAPSLRLEGPEVTSVDCTADRLVVHRDTLSVADAGTAAPVDDPSDDAGMPGASAGGRPTLQAPPLPSSSPQSSPGKGSPAWPSDFEGAAGGSAATGNGKVPSFPSEVDDTRHVKSCAVARSIGDGEPSRTWAFGALAWLGIGLGVVRRARRRARAR